MRVTGAISLSVIAQQMASASSAGVIHALEAHATQKPTNEPTNLKSPILRLWYQCKMLRGAPTYRGALIRLPNIIRLPSLCYGQKPLNHSRSIMSLSLKIATSPGFRHYKSKDSDCERKERIAFSPARS